MFILQDKNNKTIKQWGCESQEIDIVFKPQCSQLVSYFENDTGITVFYGFLDQDNPYNNPAQFLSGIFNLDGIDGLNDCYGSFIVLHYSKKQSKYSIANDALGDFAVHYIQEKKTIHISDLPQALLNKQNIEFDQQRLLHYFAVSKPQNNGSFFKNIKQLNPGHALSIDQNKVSTSRYYHPSFTIKNSHSVAELSDIFITLMQSVIQNQTQGEEKVAVMMSGGMDSTFVAANCQKANKTVSTFSYVFPKLPAANETLWIDSMRNSGFAMHTFAGESYWPLKSPWYTSINSPINNPYRHLKSVVYQQVQSQQIKILLTGVFADHLYIGYIYWLVDQIKHKPFTAIKSLYQTAKQKGLTSTLRQVSPAKFLHKTKFNSPWLNKSCQNELKQLHKRTKEFNHPHQQQFDLTFGISTAQSVWLENEHAFEHNIFVRHPFRDRRIVEFLMALPAWVLGTIHNPKQFVRSCSKGLLPQSIVNRKTITTLQPLFQFGVLDKELEKVKELITDTSCSWHNYIKKDLILNLINNPEKQHKESDQVILWQCINFELWKHRISAIYP